MNRNVATPCGRNTGFTLIELLIVIAIIALLAAILFPVFASAREKARQAACISNQKQIALAVLQYGQDYDDTLVMVSTAWFREAVDKQMRGSWINTLQPYMKIGEQTSGGTFDGTPPPSGGPVGVFVCPSFNEDLLKKGMDDDSCLGKNDEGIGASATRIPEGNWYLAHYGINFRLDCTSPTRCINSGQKDKAGTEARPFFFRAGSYFTCLDMACSQVEPITMTFGDVKEVSRHIYIGDGFTEVMPFATNPSGKSMEGTVGCSTMFGPHNGGGNYMFLDGHAKWIKGNVQSYVIQDEAGVWYEKYFSYHL